MRHFHSQAIKDEAQVGAARRAVHRYASVLGFSEDALAELDIDVQEMGTNAARYASGGGCLHWTTPPGGGAGLELFYCDKGPGIHDLERALADGVSSGGGLGTGFGAIGPGIGVGIVWAAYIQATARQPESAGLTRTYAFLGFALSEALALIGFVVPFVFGT